MGKDDCNCNLVQRKKTPERYSLFVALACLLVSDLALGMLCGPGDEGTEGHTAHGLVLHLLKGCLAELSAGIWRGKAEGPWHLGCTSEKSVELLEGEHTG